MMQRSKGAVPGLLVVASLALAFVPECRGFGIGSPVMNLKNSRLRSLKAISVAPARPVQKRFPTMQVWSNDQAIQEYRDLLEGKAPPPTEDGPAVIIGGGKLGNCIKNMGKGEDVIVTRGGAIPLELPEVGGKFPVYVCVKEDDVEEVIRSCPKEKVDDLVFMQEGCIETLLKKYGLCGNDNTQAVINFKIVGMGSRPQNCRVEMKPDSFGQPKFAGETVVCGKWADALKARLERQDIVCQKMYYRDWRRHMYEKVIFDSVFNLVGTLHDNVSIGEVGELYFNEADEMLVEINRAMRGAFALTLLYGFEERMFAYAAGRNVEFMPTKIENFKWRNGFIYGLGDMARTVGMDDPCPMHTQYLEYGRDKGIITCSFETYKIS